MSNIGLRLKIKTNWLNSKFPVMLNYYAHAIIGTVLQVLSFAHEQPPFIHITLSH